MKEMWKKQIDAEVTLKARKEMSLTGGVSNIKNDTRRTEQPPTLVVVVVGLVDHDVLIFRAADHTNVAR
jgi:hypothetical protein